MDKSGAEWVNNFRCDPKKNAQRNPVMDSLFARLKISMILANTKCNEDHLPRQGFLGILRSRHWSKNPIEIVVKTSLRGN
jgi:hypothetical protein